MYLLLCFQEVAMDFNPWHVESIEAFNFYCCPECVYRVKGHFCSDDSLKKCKPNFRKVIFERFCPSFPVFKP